MNRKLRKPIYIFVVLSLLLHSSVYISLLIQKIRPPARNAKIVEVEYVEPPPAAKKADKVNQQKAPAPVVTDQIVEQKDQLNKEVDKNTRLLSAFNQKVEQQTHAEKSGAFNNSAKGGKLGEKQKEKEKKKETEVAKEKQEEAEEPGELPKLKDLAPKFSMEPTANSGDSKENGDPSQSDDYLKDVKSGMQTLLSTREFVYYSYYARIKTAIRQHWEPDVREKVKIIYRQGRTIASARDRVTQVLVTLNAKGELINVEILNRSGVDQLDNAAIEAFKSAAPFPNPPKGMVEPDGTIKIRWDFVLEV